MAGTSYILFYALLACTGPLEVCLSIVEWQKGFMHTTIVLRVDLLVSQVLSSVVSL